MRSLIHYRFSAPAWMNFPEQRAARRALFLTYSRDLTGSPNARTSLKRSIAAVSQTHDRTSEHTTLNTGANRLAYKHAIMQHAHPHTQSASHNSSQLSSQTHLTQR